MVMSDEIRDAILAMLEKQLKKGKAKVYVSEVPRLVEGDFKKRDVKKKVHEMIDTEDIAYWSSGSTTYVMLKSEYDKYLETAESDK